MMRVLGPPTSNRTGRVGLNKPRTPLRNSPKRTNQAETPLEYGKAHLLTPHKAIGFFLTLVQARATRFPNHQRNRQHHLLGARRSPL